MLTFMFLCKDYVSDCPEKFGFFADALQCDRYYECNDGEVSQYSVHKVQNKNVILLKYYKSNESIFSQILSKTSCFLKVSEHFCPDGLVFDEGSESYAKCSFPFRFLYYVFDLLLCHI